MVNNRKKVQSAFQLPDLYVGYTTDFNRATALTAQEVTEEQVFQPERISLAWVLNNKLLNAYQFKYVEVYFKEPNITNPDDLYKVLSVCSRAGGLTPNKAKEIIYNAYGQTSENYEGEWGDIPIAISNQASGTKTEEEPEIDIDRISLSLEKQITKATRNHDDAVVAVMKEVKNLLKARQNSDIMKEGWITTEEGNHIYLDNNGNFQGGSAGYQSYASSQGTDTTATHKIVEGKDITQSFKYDPDNPKSPFDQVCEAQGFNGKPQVMEYREFMEAAKERGEVCYRTWNDSYDGTEADAFKEQFAYSEDFEAKGSGGRLYGSGTYMTATQNPKEGKMPSSSAMRYAREESRGYGDKNERTTATITFDKDAKIIERSQLLKIYEKESDEVREKSGFDLGMYAAMKGYDGIRVKNAAYKTDYIAVCNRTKCIIFDDINEPDEDKRGF